MTYPAPSRELFLKQQATNEKRAREARDASADTLSALSLTLPSAAIKEQREDQNAYVLSPGNHSISRLTSRMVKVDGIGSAAIVTPLQLEGDAAIFNGLSFRAGGEYLVKIGPTSSVIFSGCVFERERTSAASDAATQRRCYVLVKDGGQARFVGCFFVGGPTAAGFVIINEGDPANVEVIGCVNNTGLTI